MNNRVCIVTGGNSGIGRETVKGLASMGASVIMVTRDKTRGEEAMASIIEETGNKTIELMICDLSLMSNIRKLTEQIIEKYRRIDVLINNAGAVFAKRKETSEGFENTLAVNYLAPFLLTHLLLPSLKSNTPSRVINLTSGLHKQGKLDLEDLQSKHDYDGTRAYSTTKLMILMHSYHLGKLIKSIGVSVNAVQPGFAATNLGKNSGSFSQRLMFGTMRPIQISAAKAAETSIYLASDREVEGMTAKCYSKKKIVTTSAESHDEEKQKHLYDETLRLLNLSP